MKLRVWWIPQIPMKRFFVPVEGFVQAKLILEVLAQYDLFQLENNIKPDFSNVGGLEVWNEDSSDDDGNCAWEEWYDYDQADPCATYGNIDDIDNERATELDRRNGIINKVIEAEAWSRLPRRTEKSRDEAVSLVNDIAAYRDHLSGCAHWTEQTSECCNCGLVDLRKKYIRIKEILKGQS